LSFAFANMVDDFWDRFVHLDPYRSSWFMFIGTAVRSSSFCIVSVVTNAGVETTNDEYIYIAMHDLLVIYRYFCLRDPLLY
jgi:hypothetical protein